MSNRRPLISEDTIQRAIFDHYWLRGKPNSVLAAIPNGGLRNPIVAAKMKAAGATAGMPDIFACSRSAGAFFIELKRRGGRLSTAQSVMIERLNAAGVAVHVIMGLDEALDLLEHTGILRAEVMP